MLDLAFATTFYVEHVAVLTMTWSYLRISVIVLSLRNFYLTEIFLNFNLVKFYVWQFLRFYSTNDSRVLKITYNSHIYQCTLKAFNITHYPRR